MSHYPYIKHSRYRASIRGRVVGEWDDYAEFLDQLKKLFAQSPKAVIKISCRFWDQLAQEGPMQSVDCWAEYIETFQACKVCGQSKPYVFFSLEAVAPAKRKERARPFTSLITGGSNVLMERGKICLECAERKGYLLARHYIEETLGQKPS